MLSRIYGVPEPTEAEDVRSSVNGVEKLGHSDSQYVTRAFNDAWLDRWQQNGWRTANGQPVLNQDLWTDLLAETKELNIRWEWVTGHSGDPRLTATRWTRGGRRTRRHPHRLPDTPATDSTGRHPFLPRTTERPGGTIPQNRMTPHRFLRVAQGSKMPTTKISGPGLAFSRITTKGEIQFRYNI